MELLKAIGYPASTIIIILSLAYIFRLSFSKMLESIVSRDLEALKHQNSQALEEIKADYQLELESKRAELVQHADDLRNKFSLELESKKAEFNKETENLKSALSVEFEVYRLAAQKRFKYLLGLWESSESLFKDTDFSDMDSIKTSLAKVDEAIRTLNRFSIL